MPTVFKGRVFSVEVETHRSPDGREHRVEVVRHPAAVVIIPLEDDGRVVLIRQYRPALGRELWELPAGSINDGEVPAAAARRECEEEINRAPLGVEPLAALYPSPGYCDEQMMFFKATGLHQPPPDSPHKPDEDEHIVARAVSADEARAMVRRGEIVDLKTAYALTLI